jgi:DNA-binding CsgD family transcriptional regulator
MSIAFFIEKGLTKTQAETALLFVQGHSIIEICVIRNKGISTIKDHWTQAKRKLNVENRVQLANLIQNKNEKTLEARIVAIENQLQILLKQSGLPIGIKK